MTRSFKNIKNFVWGWNFTLLLCVRGCKGWNMFKEKVCERVDHVGNFRGKSVTGGRNWNLTVVDLIVCNCLFVPISYL